MLPLNNRRLDRGVRGSRGSLDLPLPAMKPAHRAIGECPAALWSLLVISKREQKDHRQSLLRAGGPLATASRRRLSPQSRRVPDSPRPISWRTSRAESPAPPAPTEMTNFFRAGRPKWSDDNKVPDK